MSKGSEWAGVDPRLASAGRGRYFGRLACVADDESQAGIGACKIRHIAGGHERARQQQERRQRGEPAPRLVSVFGSVADHAVSPRRPRTRI